MKNFIQPVGATCGRPPLIADPLYMPQGLMLPLGCVVILFRRWRVPFGIARKEPKGDLGANIPDEHRMQRAHPRSKDVPPKNPHYGGRGIGLYVL